MCYQVQILAGNEILNRIQFSANRIIENQKRRNWLNIPGIVEWSHLVSVERDIVPSFVTVIGRVRSHVGQAAEDHNGRNQTRHYLAHWESEREWPSLLCANPRLKCNDKVSEGKHFRGWISHAPFCGVKNTLHIGWIDLSVSQRRWVLMHTLRNSHFHTSFFKLLLNQNLKLFVWI